MHKLLSNVVLSENISFTPSLVTDINSSSGEVKDDVTVRAELHVGVYTIPANA